MHIVYGTPPADLVELPRDAVQASPTIAGSSAIEGIEDACAISVLAKTPRGAIERRYVLAHLLRSLKAGGRLVALAPKFEGGNRLRDELAAFGCEPDETARHHHRICVCIRPPTVTGLEAALAAGALQRVEPLGLWSQPGVFSWDRIDPGSALLMQHLPALSGRGADLGCGIGVLARAVLAMSQVTQFDLVDSDRRAIAAARRNVDDRRALFHWARINALPRAIVDLDFVVTNPPFHDGGSEDPDLGRAFIRAAARLLRDDGVCVLVANRHLPYEAEMQSLFVQVDIVAQANGYKIYVARK